MDNEDLLRIIYCVDSVHTLFSYTTNNLPETRSFHTLRLAISSVRVILVLDVEYDPESKWFYL